MKILKPYLALLLAAALPLAGCNQKEEASAKPAESAAPAATEAAAPAAPAEGAAPAAGPLVATVNGAAITEAMLDAYSLNRVKKPAKELDAEQRQALVGELVNQELILQDAAKRGMDADPAIAVQVENARRVTLATLVMHRVLEEQAIGDDVIKAEYEQRIAEGGGSEYKARHILVADEDAAKAIIAELDGGADFAELAKTKSTGPSGKDGGDLGWFSAGQMVQPFSDAVAALDNGTYTKAPVQTQFGWHVILRENSRELSPPPFEEVKERVRSYLKNRQLQDYVQGLHAQAQIELK